MSQLQCSLALYKEVFFIGVFNEKDAYGIYLSYATLGSNVACLETEVFNRPGVAWAILQTPL